MRQLKIAKSITNRESQALEQYLQEISRYDLITPEQEVALAVRIRQGDMDARDQLVNANLRFVVSVAKQYQFRGVSLSDLINEGNAGLIKAAEKFDETRGFKFVSYAVWWIRQSIMQALSENGDAIRIPLNKTGIRNKMLKASEAFLAREEREPSTEELAELLGERFDTIEEIQLVPREGLSFDAPPPANESGATLYEHIADHNVTAPDQTLIDAASLACDVRTALTMLSDRQREVICLYYGIGEAHPVTLEEIGQRINITRERVRQVRDKALARLKGDWQAAALLAKYLAK